MEFALIIIIVIVTAVVFFWRLNQPHYKSARKSVKEFTAQNLTITHEKYDIWIEEGLSGKFNIYENGHSIATCSYSPILRKGLLENNEESYTIHREGLFSLKFVFKSSKGLVATAKRLYRNSLVYEFECADGIFKIMDTFPEISIFNGSTIIGLVDEEEEVVIPKSWSRESKLIVLWLLHIVWLQSHKKDSGAGGMV